METGKPRMSLWRIDTLLVVLLLGFAHPINFDNIHTYCTSWYPQRFCWLVYVPYPHITSSSFFPQTRLFLEMCRKQTQLNRSPLISFPCWLVEFADLHPPWHHLPSILHHCQAGHRLFAVVQPRPGGHGGASEDHLTNDLLSGMIPVVKACESCNATL